MTFHEEIATVLRRDNPVTAQSRRHHARHQTPLGRPGIRQPQEGFTPHDDKAILIVCKPDRALAVIVLGNRECRLVSYGNPYDAEKRQEQTGADGITIRSVDFVRVWGPKLWDRPGASRQMQTFVHTVISTLPKPR